jgi:hypothetical protein
MKFLGFLVIVLAVFYFLIYPPASQEKICYDTTQKAITDISYFTASRGWSQAEVCQRRTEVLLDLGDCIDKVKVSSLATKYANGVVEAVLPLIRPSAIGYQTLKSDHNAECSEYERYRLE